MKINPSPIILKALESLKPGTVLDIGPGRGNNATYLVDKGFEVSVVDIDQKILDEVALNPKISTTKAHLASYEFPNKFDNILCNFVLHFLSEEKFLPTIRKIQDNTEIGGINVISDFLTKGQMNTNGGSHWLKSGELKEIYKDWEVIYYEESVSFTRHRDEDGYPKYHMAAHIIAKKIKD